MFIPMSVYLQIKAARPQGAGEQSSAWHETRNQETADLWLQMRLWFFAVLSKTNTERNQGNVSHDSSPSLDPVDGPIGGSPTGDMETSVSGDDRRSNGSCFHGLHSHNQPRGKRPRAPGALVIYITSEISVMRLDFCLVTWCFRYVIPC